MEQTTAVRSQRIAEAIRDFGNTWIFRIQVLQSIWSGFSLLWATAHPKGIFWSTTNTSQGYLKTTKEQAKWWNISSHSPYSRETHWLTQHSCWQRAYMKPQARRTAPVLFTPASEAPQPPHISSLRSWTSALQHRDFHPSSATKKPSAAPPPLSLFPEVGKSLCIYFLDVD